MDLPIARLLILLCIPLFGLVSGIGGAYAYKDIPPKHSWQTVIAGHEATPPRLVAVDKKRQQLFVFERSSPLKVTKAYLCSTGQVAGDKYVEGDLRTPEGVYFVVQHVSSGLDFTMYGKEAYTLNYPNPVDKLRKKTGYGIWIHGRGQGIAPLQTQGCVALNNSDIAVLGKLLKPGTPVILSSTLSQAPTLQHQEKTVKTLENLVTSWAKAWGDRSAKMFDFYDKEAYTASTESFSNFRKTKERLFKSLPWIKTSVRDIQVLQGPDYWVTWFYQDYAAPNLSTKGVRRLYWGEDGKGGFKVIGMEWVPGQTTGPLLAMSEPASNPIEENPRTEPQAPEGILPEVDSSGGTEVSRQQTTPDLRGPGSAEEKMPEASAEGVTRQMATPDTARTVSPELPASPRAPELKPLPDGVRVAEPLKEDAPPSLEEQLESRLTEASDLVEHWRQAWEKGNVNTYIGFYAVNAKQGSRTSVKSIKAQKEQLWNRVKPASVVLRNIKLTALPNAIHAEMVQEYKDAAGGGDKGIKTLRIELINGKLLITDEQWRPAR